MNQSTSSRTVTAAQMERLTTWSRRKPVIAIMGEFSAGKSTLMNLLVDQDILPTQVTATRLPPVWLRYGEGEPYRVDHNGKKHPVDISDPASIPTHDTRFIRIYCKADILKACDLMDTPGISDPNIPVKHWIDTIGYANGVMWCTHSGQSWRESERGAWMALPERLRDGSLLLVTRKDKIASETDLKKIDRRLERESGELFSGRIFVSLTRAIRARNNGDQAAWNESGAQDFLEKLDKVIKRFAKRRSEMLSRYEADGASRAPLRAEPRRVEPLDMMVLTQEHSAEEPEAPKIDTVAESQPEAPEGSDRFDKLRRAFYDSNAAASEEDGETAVLEREEPEPEPEYEMEAFEDPDDEMELEAFVEPEDDVEDTEDFQPSSIISRLGMQDEEPLSAATSEPESSAERDESVVHAISAAMSFRKEETEEETSEPVAQKQPEITEAEDTGADADTSVEELELVLEILDDVQGRYDISKSPRLASALNTLLSELEEDARCAMNCKNGCERAGNCRKKSNGQSENAVYARSAGSY